LAKPLSLAMVLQANARAAFWSSYIGEPRWHFTYPAAGGFSGASLLRTNTAVGVSGAASAQDRCLVWGPTAPTTFN
jgi:hypothetical protein